VPFAYTLLYYLNARYYDPATGRFISQDTYRGETNDSGQWHLYTYCANNPVNYVDPSGHYVVSIGCRFEASAFLGGYCVIAINAGKTYVSCTLTKGFRVSATIQVSLTVFSTIYFNKNISNLMTFIFRNKRISWNISKWNIGQIKWDRSSTIFS